MKKIRSISHTFVHPSLQQSLIQYTNEYMLFTRGDGGILIVIIFLIVGGCMFYTFIKPLDSDREEILSVHATQTPKETSLILDHNSEQRRDYYK
jgi:hypothetical protein